MAHTLFHLVEEDNLIPNKLPDRIQAVKRGWSNNSETDKQKVYSQFQGNVDDLMLCCWTSLLHAHVHPG